MKIKRFRDGTLLELRDSEARWMIDHGYAEPVDPDTGQGDGQPHTPVAGQDEAAPAKRRRSPRKPKTTTHSDTTEDGPALDNDPTTHPA